MNPEKPVALVHVVGLDHSNWYFPNEQGKLHVEAAATLYEQGEISKIVFTGGEYRRGRRPMGDAMVDYAALYLDNPNLEDLVSVPKAVTTRAEIKVFKQLADQNGWNNLLDISINSQLRRIQRRLLIEFGREISTMSVESILGIEEIGKGVSSRENMLTIIDSLPIIGSINDWLAHQVPSKCYLEQLITEKL